VDERVEQQVDGEQRQLDDQHQGVPEFGQSHSFDRPLLSAQWTVHGGQLRCARAAAVLEQAGPPLIGPLLDHRFLFYCLAGKLEAVPIATVCSPRHSCFRPVNIKQRTAAVGNK